MVDIVYLYNYISNDVVININTRSLNASKSVGHKTSIVNTLSYVYRNKMRMRIVTNDLTPVRRMCVCVCVLCTYELARRENTTQI